MLTRRKLLTTTSLGGAAVMLAGCPSVSSISTTTVATGIGTAAEDISTLATGLEAILAPLATITGIPGSVLTTVSNAVGAIQSIASQISAATSTAGAQPLVQQIETDINGIINALAYLPAGLVPQPVALAITAAQVLLPVIETAVNLVVPASVAKAGAAAPMTADGARAYLKSLAK